MFEDGMAYVALNFKRRDLICDKIKTSKVASQVMERLRNNN